MTPAQVRLSASDSREKLSGAVGELHDRLLTLLSSLYAGIDYPDEDLAAWRDHASQASPLWLCGFDFEGVLKSDTMYYLRAIPSLYLLDAERRVLLKDAPAERVIFELKKRAL